MSQPTDPKHDELADRLMDQALGEVLSGSSPPDLTERILAAVENQEHVSLQRKEPVMSKSRRRRNWAIGGTVASLVVCLAVASIIAGGGRDLRKYLASRVLGEGTAPSSSPTQQTTVAKPPQAGEVVTGGAETAQASPPREPATAGQSLGVLQQEALTTEQQAQNRIKSKGDVVDVRSLGLKPAGLWEMRPGESKPVPVFSPASTPTDAPQPGRRQVVAQQEQGVPAKPIYTAIAPASQPTPYYLSDNVTYGDSSRPPTKFPLGQGPGQGGDKYDRVVDNPFRAVKDNPLSTFSIDVDTASYANVRRFLMEEDRLPPPDAVRIEEMVNYFHYDYAGPKDDVSFAAHLDVAGCPWTPEHRLVRIGLKGKEIAAAARPSCNLVFLLDVSGSMDSPDKLPLVKAGMKLLADQMRDNDRVAIVVYAQGEGLVLPSTPGTQRQRVVEAIGRLEAGGSTNGGAGIELAYRIAKENFIPKGVNRVILCTDGDFNVGTTSTGDLVRKVEEKARDGVFLSVLGFGRGNLNDSMMETISNKGNGNYAYIDGPSEARKVLVEQMGATLVTIAKDVKIQVEFNPARVAAFRLIGYENRMLAAEDFNDDKKDAGEIGAGHAVTALYEIIPAGGKVDAPSVDPLRYQAPAKPETDKPAAAELLTVKLRYKQPDGDKSKLQEFAVTDAGAAFTKADADFQFAAAVAEFGMLLRGSQFKGAATYDAVLEIATAAKGPDPNHYRAEFLDLVRRAKTLAGQ